MPEIITLGETMICFTPINNDTLQYAGTFEKRIAGAESNVAIALSKLGHSTGWISRLGNDSFGLYIRNTIRGEGVDISQVKFDGQHNTGLMFKQLYNGGETDVTYYRRDSAACHIMPEHINEDYFTDCRIFHTTGINAIISEQSLHTLLHTIKLAKTKGCLISFDPNIRLKLCSPEKIRHQFLDIFTQTDIALLGIDEAEILFHTRDHNTIIKELLNLGIQYIGLKSGSQGAIVADRTHTHFINIHPATCIDPVGAGDAFNSGFLAGLIEQESLRICGEYGSAMGSLAVRCRGDFENSPTRQTLTAFLNGKPNVYR